jgi:hypothetical protein
MAEALAVSPPSVHQMMKTLEKKGFIRRQPGVPRSIEILVDRDTIPKWKGKRITRTIKVWTLTKSAARQIEKVSGHKSAVYRFKIVLQATKPVIWRRIETQDVTLNQLHALIQTAMGWTNSHLYQFKIKGTRYVDHNLVADGWDDPDMLDDSSICISDLLSKHGGSLQIGYVYDFGDRWQHAVVLEEVTESAPRVKYPRCIDGAQACPPEDVGGVYGFAEYLEAITNPKHREHRDYLEWNGPFDPAKFNAATATRRMREGLPAW